MKELSPAAQAAKDYFLANVPISLEDGLAAAIRAAVEQISFQDQLGLTAYGGHSQAQSQLLAIVSELENCNV